MNSCRSIVSGGDNRRRLHGGVGAAVEERESARPRDSEDVAGTVERGEAIQDTASPQRAAAASNRHTHGTVRRWSRRPEDAQVLPLRGYREHGVEDGVERFAAQDTRQSGDQEGVGLVRHLRHRAQG